MFPIYMLLLACIPCTDVDENAALNQTTITASAQSSNNEDPEICSPFCICNCCGQRLLNPQFVTFNVIPGFFITVKQMITHFFALQNVISQIWQPPKLH